VKVLVLSTNADLAGAPMHVLTLLRALRDRVKFMAVFGEPGPVVDRLADLGIPVQIVPTMRSRLSPWQDMAAIRAVARLAREFGPDLIHCHSSKAGMVGRWVASRLDVPSLYTVHGWGWRGQGRIAAPLIAGIERVLSRLPRSDFLYVSHSVAEEGRARLGLATMRGRVVHNGVDDLGMHAEPPSPPWRILMPARVTLAKDHETLVRAFEALDEAAAWELVLCGDGTDSAAFRDQLRQWAPTRHGAVQVLGQRSDVADWLRRSHVFALISRFEALPVSIIEAMSAGRAVVASLTGGVPELVRHGENGLLVPVGDVAALVEALHGLREARERQRLAHSARYAYESHFGSAAMADAVWQAYMDATRVRTGRPA
jgi:glycosyltransferase involved in cell wall biosynthesis